MPAVLGSRSKEPNPVDTLAANKVLKKAKDGTDFGNLVVKYSGEDLGWIERNTLPTEWEVIVFAMTKGEVRGPIKGENGLHVFYVADVEKAVRKPFDDVKEALRDELFRRELNRQTIIWIDELRKKAHVETSL